jgi:uncharacterized protein YhfF
MRAPMFKSVLETFRDSRRGPPKEVLAAWAKIDWYKRHATPAAERDPLPPPLIGNRNGADTELLNRWIADDRAEGIWQQVHRHAPDLPAEELIQQVISARRSAVASVNRVLGFTVQLRGRTHTLKSFNVELAEMLRTLKRELPKQLSGPPASIDAIAVAEFLEDAAHQIRILHLRLDHSDQVSFPLIRQGSNDDRAHAAFEELMGEFFQKHNKRKLKLQEAVAVLSEIAIPGKAVDPESIIRRQSRRRQKS